VKPIRSPPSAAAELQQAVEQAVRRLQQGGLVAIPTETVYGLAADASNEQAVQSIFSAKGRPADHPLIVHVAAPSMQKHRLQIDRMPGLS
jgi:L-threonylcarbamoyladenylate synthase